MINKLIYKSNNIESDSQMIFEHIKQFQNHNLLLVNLTQENRELEKLFEIESFIIYNSYDYFLDTCDLEKAIYEIDDTIHILPSTVKSEDTTIDLSILDKDLDSNRVGFDHTLEEDDLNYNESISDEEDDLYQILDYDYTLVIYDDFCNLINIEGYEELNLKKPGFLQKLLSIFKGKKND